MKRIFQLLIFFVMALQFNLHSQSPIVQQIVDSANQDSLMYFVKELSGNVPTIINGTLQTIVSRNKYQPGNALAETYIKQKLQYYGLTTSIQSFSSTGKNVLGVQVGSELPNQKYIICAHYDDMPSGSTAPGADDNASGTSAVLEAARIFSQYTFPFTIVYALWDEEEQGLVGSNYYANQAAASGDSIIGVINMDMIAYDSDNDMAANIHTRNVGTSLELYDKMIEANIQYGINLNLIEYNPGEEYSDHASFWNAGYGAILLIEDDADFNAYYHSVNDLITHFNEAYYLKSAKLAYATLASFVLNLNMQIIHTPFASIDYSQDIELTANIVTGLNIGSGISGPRLYYRTSTGGGFSNFIEVAGTPLMSNAEYSFIIPAQQLGTIVQYYLAAQDDNSSVVVTLPTGGGGFNPPGNIPPLQAFQFFVAPVTFAFVDSANNTNNWQSTGGWNITSQKFVSAPYSFTESPSGNYQSNTTATFTYLNDINLSNILGASLEFYTQWDIENDWDYGQVQVSTNGGISWTALEGLHTNPGTGTFQPPDEPLFDGTQLSWVVENMDLSEFINQNIKLRFYFQSDQSVTGDGWYIDDIRLMTFAIVPVELTSFTATVGQNSVSLNWQTATETNNSGFEIERKQVGSPQSSVGNQDWNQIAFVPGFGTTTEPKSYSFIDENLSSGKYQYRLKQIDFDGTFEYSNTIEVEVSSPLEISLEQNYPNPFNPTTKIKYTIPFVTLRWQSHRHAQGDILVSLKVFDVLGNEVATLINEQQQPGSYEVEFNADKLSSSVYYYQLRAGSFVETKKMILVK
jgi:hypothetical protein